MSLISPKEFSRIRLRKLLPGKQIFRTWSFEYLGRLWLGHTHGFSHALRPYSSPFQTKSIAIDMEDASDEALLNLSRQIGVEVKRSLTAEECLEKYGTPIKTYEFADDRKTHCFAIRPGYEIGFTILNAGGLVYFTMESADVAIARHGHGRITDPA